MTKKLLIFGLLLVPLVALADRFLVRFSSGNPNLPNGWPAELSNKLPDDYTDVPAGWSSNWTGFQLKAHIAGLQPQFDAIQQAQANMALTNRNAKLKLLADLFDDFQTYENGWQSGTNYTAAQMQVILRKHNGALLLLKPMLKELYDSRQ